MIKWKNNINRPCLGMWLPYNLVVKELTVYVCIPKWGRTWAIVWAHTRIIWARKKKE